jgi:hypothetical protein
MNSDLAAAQRRLQAAGLVVRAPTDNSLWVAGHLTEVEAGVNLSQDACGIQRRDGSEYVAVFPSDSEILVEVPGTIPDLVSLILAMYLRHRRQGGSFGATVGTVLREADVRSLAGVA